MLFQCTLQVFAGWPSGIPVYTGWTSDIPVASSVHWLRVRVLLQWMIFCPGIWIAIRTAVTLISTLPRIVHVKLLSSNPVHCVHTLNILLALTYWRTSQSMIISVTNWARIRDCRQKAKHHSHQPHRWLGWWYMNTLERRLTTDTALWSSNVNNDRESSACINTLKAILVEHAIPLLSHMVCCVGVKC